MLIETPYGENPLLGIAFEDNSGTVVLESSNLSVIADVGQKIIIDGLINVGTAFVLNETSGEYMKTEDHGNLLLQEDGDKLLFETDVTGGDMLVLDGTDASSNNAADSLIIQDKIDFSGNDVVITDSGGASGTVILADIATGDVTAGIIQTTRGSYLNVKNLIGEDLIRIQDSYYYQQFSYEVQVGQSTAAYLNELKKAVHPAGFAPFGKVSVATFLSAAISNAGSSMYTPSPSTETFSPILASAIETIFDEKFTRTHYVPRVQARVGNRTDAIILNGTDGSSTNAGDNLLFESGTVTHMGLGGKIMNEDSHTPGNQQLVFIPIPKIIIQSVARTR
jgi:hypothetical protein